jgi:cell wall assembly regulator SMI1
MARAKSKTVADAWAVIHKWLDQHAPLVGEKLNPPADERALTRLAAAVGRELPEDFLVSYRIHDGADPVSGPILGVPLLSAAEIIKKWKGLKPQRGQDCPAPEQPVSARPGAIREVGWCPGWVPFAGPDEENYLALDFDPGPAGTPGQVISFGADQFIYGTPRYVLAPSFGAFLGLLADLFARGEAEVPPDEPDSDFLQLARRRADGAACNLLTGIQLLFRDERQTG